MRFNSNGKNGDVDINAPYFPKARTFRYRFGYQHLFSFFWLGWIVWIGIQALTFPKRQTSDFIIFIVLFLPFTCLGVWAQMTGWIEKIHLDRNGIIWVDWKGEVQVRATLDQIRKVTYVHRRDQDVFWKGDALEIDTDIGMIEASIHLWGSDNLRKDVEKVIETRRQKS
jgi:hypothetical protein